MRTTSPEESLITSADVASMIGCSPRTVTNLVRDGRLPKPTRIGRLVRWHRSVINSFLAASL